MSAKGKTTCDPSPWPLEAVRVLTVTSAVIKSSFQAERKTERICNRNKEVR